MPEAPKTLHFGAICEQNKNLHFSQTFFQKIVDIHKGIVYNTTCMLRVVGYNYALTDHNDMR